MNASSPSPAPNVPPSDDGGEDYRRSRRKQHAWMLAASLAVLAIALACYVRDDSAVSVRGFDFALPGVCNWYRFTGYPCAGCGMTRSVISLAAGDVEQAWAFNPAGILLFGAMLFQYPYRAGQIWRLSHGRSEWRPHGAKIFWWMFFIVLFAQWILRLVFYA